MLKIEAVATTWFTCNLTDEEEKKVVDYIKENPDEFEFMGKKDSISKAVEILYENDEINLYDNATESDFSTDEIKWSEFEERTAEEILDRLQVLLPFLMAESEEIMDFKKGDRVLHKNLQMKGTFVEYDWTGKDESWVDFDNEDGYEDCRHISTNQLVLIEEE